MQVLLVILMAVVFAGCATTRQTAENNQLQMRVAQLESKLEERDQEMEDLKFQVKELSSHSDSEQPSSLSSRNLSEMAVTSSATSTGSDEEIIRVSASVEDVQRALKNAGNYSGSVDGKLGSASKRAIKDFQHDHNLASDGVVGKKTWAELKSYLK